MSSLSPVVDHGSGHLLSCDQFTLHQTQMQLDIKGLEKTIKECTDHCLFATAEWYTSIHYPLDDCSISSSRLAELAVSIPREQHQEPTSSSCAYTQESHAISVASIYFRARQWNRVVFILDRHNSDRAIFLKAYSRYLVSPPSLLFAH